MVEIGTPDGGTLHMADGITHLPPARARAFLGLVRAGETLARELDAELRALHGISLRGFEVLLFLAVFAPEGRLRVSELAERAPLSQSRVSRLVAELEGLGLVRRSTAEGDARGVEVTITKAGMEKFSQAGETHLRGLEARLFSHLSEEEIEQLAGITGRILEACGVRRMQA